MGTTGGCAGNNGPVADRAIAFGVALFLPCVVVALLLPLRLIPLTGPTANAALILDFFVAAVGMTFFGVVQAARGRLAISN